MRSRLITAGIALAAFVLTAPAWARGNPVAFRPSPIATPAGAHPVGRIDTALTDHGRTIMVSAWYPTLETGAPVPYIPASGPAAQARIASVSASWMHTPGAAVRMVGAQAAATESAAVVGDRLPVVVVSPGMATPRWILSGLAADLASRGYAVIVIDHTGESPAVELPDGGIQFGTAPTVNTEYMAAQLSTRTADMRLVLDRLTTLPTVGPHLDPSRIAALGHSYGGTTAVQLAAADPRIQAVVSIDGPAGWDGVATAPDIELPVLLLDLTGTWTSSWDGFRDSRFERAVVVGAGHYSAADLCAFGGGAELCGTITADQAATATRTVIAEWLDKHL